METITISEAPKHVGETAKIGVWSKIKGFLFQEIDLNKHPSLKNKTKQKIKFFYIII